MLTLTKGQISQPVAERIRRWLGAEGSQDFAQWLRTMSAIKTAEAGNLLSETGTQEEVRALAAEAEHFHKFADLLQECRMPDRQFETIEIIPVPITNIPTTEE